MASVAKAMKSAFGASGDAGDAGCASRKRRSQGSDGARRGKKIPFWVWILFLAVFFLPAIASAIGAMVRGVVSEFTDDGGVTWEAPWDDSSHVRELTSEIDEEAGEEEITQISTDRLNNLADDQELIDALNASLSEECAWWLGYTAEELGIESDGYATWVISGLSYEISSSYCFDGYDHEDPSGTVYFDTTLCDTYDVAARFTEEAADYLDSEGIDAYGGAEDLPELSDEQQAHLRELFAQVIAEAEPELETFSSFEFVYRDGAWQIDEDAYREELTTIFRLY